MWDKRKFISAIIVLLLLGGSIALIFVRCGHPIEQKESVSVDTAKVLLHQIQECSRLYTTEVEVRKVITHDDNVAFQTSVLSRKIDINLPFGKRKVAIPVEATLKAYIDFSDFDENSVSINGDKVEVFLPEPRVVMTHTKIHHEDIRKNIPLLRSDFSDDELTQYEIQGRNDIIKSIPHINIIPMAREGAAKVLVPLFEQFGFKPENVTVSFCKDFTFSDIKKFVVSD